MQRHLTAVDQPLLREVDGEVPDGFEGKDEATVEVDRQARELLSCLDELATVSAQAAQGKKLLKEKMGAALIEEVKVDGVTFNVGSRVHLTVRGFKDRNAEAE